MRCLRHERNTFSPYLSPLLRNPARLDIAFSLIILNFFHVAMGCFPFFLLGASLHAQSANGKWRERKKARRFKHKPTSRLKRWWSWTVQVHWRYHPSRQSLNNDLVELLRVVDAWHRIVSFFSFFLFTEPFFPAGDSRFSRFLSCCWSPCSQTAPASATNSHSIESGEHAQTKIGILLSRGIYLSRNFFTRSENLVSGMEPGLGFWLPVGTWQKVVPRQRPWPFSTWRSGDRTFQALPKLTRRGQKGQKGYRWVDCVFR